MEQESRIVGTIASIWRYPVKSMRGEVVETAQLSARGVAGDRAYALLEVDTGHVVSAKHARKWGKVLTCRACYLAEPQFDTPLPPIQFTLPDGQTVTSDDPDIDQILSAALGSSVKLIQHAPAHPTREANRAPVELLASEELIRQEPLAPASSEGTFFDYAPLHLLTSATLARLRTLYPAGQLDVRRFRPNLLIATEADEGFVENVWLGHDVEIGDGIRVSVFDPTPRCVITTLPQGDLAQDLNILRTVTTHNAAASVTLAPGVLLDAVAGVYGRTADTGVIEQGMPVRLHKLKED